MSISATVARLGGDRIGEPHPEGRIAGRFCQDGNDSNVRVALHTSVGG